MKASARGLTPHAAGPTDALSELAGVPAVSTDLDALRVTPLMWPIIWDSLDYDRDGAAGAARICVTCAATRSVDSYVAEAAEL